MTESQININVQLDDEKIPQGITWSATGSTAASLQQANAMFLAFWDAKDKSALRIDLWTKEMMVDEMADFFYQTLFTMADTYNRATHHEDLTEEMKAFAKSFYQKFKDKQLQENK